MNGDFTNSIDFDNMVRFFFICFLYHGYNSYIIPCHPLTLVESILKIGIFHFYSTNNRLSTLEDCG